MSKSARTLSSLELLTLASWRAWGANWSMYTACASCGEVKACRGKTRHHMLCLDCFDQSVEA